ncbi:hypothetical protein MATL_G00116940 [Megalops atlanticus]|uniref:Uncharacterized protein n=1 Tax=Megalops atlanticus TaxID=7932 RepID=A0A9D3T7Z0_MEGAT|nr:hypothetical protein MATL_G00116940 [Megalops atlanticus]
MAEITTIYLFARLLVSSQFFFRLGGKKKGGWRRQIFDVTNGFSNTNTRFAVPDLSDAEAPFSKQKPDEKNANVGS